MKTEKAEPEVLDHPNEVSPNDHGNKKTRDWYFSEEERLDANKTYGRLWGLSFLERNGDQLIAKRAYIFNAPAAMRDTVKLKHKVFKSNSYTTEVRLLQQFSITERFEEEEDDVL
ncbi:unnamed protein product [Peronospora farinosa]|uniref:Uncharacterized protein n=1 Tax=Peronospora farinosa TaxID=134698 RepID=A0ABN8C8Z4_9STRA|nr:unnamed protein product [Peronospora farinosa]